MTAGARARHRAAILLPVAVIAAIALAGLLLHDHYGISTDERFEVAVVVWNLGHIGRDRPWRELPSDSEHYGFAWNLLSVTPFVLEQWASGNREGFGRVLQAGIDSPALYHSKHLFTVWFALFAYGAAAVCAGRLLGPGWAAAAVGLLALAPRFWGHSFFNPKDIPFATVMTLAAALGAPLSVRLRDAAAEGPLRRLVAPSLGLGALAGIAASVRVAGLVVLGFAGICALALLAADRHLRPGPGLRLAGAGILAGGVALALTFVLYPASWQEPFTWLGESLAYFSQHSWSHSNLLFGTTWREGQAPGYYVPAWLGVTTPLPTLLLGAAGWALLARRLPSLTPARRAVWLWLTLQMLVLPGAAMLAGSTVYNGIRHFLFVLPPLAVFAAVGARALVGAVRPVPGKAAVVAAGLAFYALVGWEMARLHPLEYTWFNRLVRGPDLSRRFDTDYWGLSVRPAMEWIARQRAGPDRVVFDAAYANIGPFAPPWIALRSAKDGAWAPPFYQVASPRNRRGEPRHPHDRHPECPVVHRVTRPLGVLAPREVVFTVVRRCR